MSSPIPPFVEEIDSSHIELFEVVGKGTFGTVKKGKWRDKDVAVKLIETEQERVAFLVEVRQLSRVNHPNIVKLYGACTKPSSVCLVMEYAEGGSLYNVLHRMPNTHYTAAHAVSWALQCASGVAYLHNMKPKALIHRDLKPPNMLLIMNGTVLKICDFGTACDLQTVMTNSKGSAAWMAPEVFESNRYSEKCDVFSWGIILWEMLTRNKPFDDIGGPAFRIMWAVHNGVRPPLIRGCPRPLENLMTRCWDKEPSERPSMSEVEWQLRILSRFFKGAEKPITAWVEEKQPESKDNSLTEEDLSQRMDMLTMASGASTCIGTSILAPLPALPATSQHPALNTRRTSAPVSPSSNKEALSDLQNSVRPKDSGKRRSADLSTILEKKQPQPQGHRRSGSWGNPLQRTQNVVVPTVRAGSRESLVPEHMRLSLSPRIPLKVETGSNMIMPWPSPNPSSGEDTPIFPPLNAHLLLEPKFQPLPPAPNCLESLELYESHCRLAQDFFKVQTEIEVFQKRKTELSRALQRQEQLNSSIENLQEFLHLNSEKEGLLEYKKNLKKQLEFIKAQRNNAGALKSSEEWVMI